MAVPTVPPTEFQQGTLVKWTVLLADYNPATWALTYDFASATYQKTIAATNNGDGSFLITITPTEATAFIAGDYVYTAKVTKVAEVYQVDSGHVTVRPALTSAVDARSHVKKVLDALEALLEGKAVADVASYSIQGRSLARMSADELLRWRDLYKIEYARELQAERIRHGMGMTGVVRVRLQ